LEDGVPEALGDIRRLDVGGVEDLLRIIEKIKCRKRLDYTNLFTASSKHTSCPQTSGKKEDF